jgi:hypothetical protein
MPSEVLGNVNVSNTAIDLITLEFRIFLFSPANQEQYYRDKNWDFLGHI